MVKMENYLCQENIQELWLKIDHLHINYLEMEESSNKIEQRSRLEACIKDFLYIASPQQKFALHETEDVLYRSAANKKDFSGYKAATGFNAIQMYAGNLISQPWRKEYHQIRTYCGFYKHQVEANLLGADRIFEAMGYKYIGNGILQLDGPICPDRVSHVSRDCLIAYVECQILKHIWEEVSPMFNISWLDMLEFRKVHLSDPKQCVQFIQYNLKQGHYQDKLSNLHSKYPTLSHSHPAIQNGNSCNSFPSQIHTAVSPYTAATYSVCMNGCCPHMYSTCNYLPFNPHLALKRSSQTVLPPAGHYPSDYPNTPSSCSYPVPTAQLIELETPNGYDVVDAPTVSSRPRKTTYPTHDVHERPYKNGAIYNNGVAKSGGNEEFENWDYVYRNLESRGYTKDLGERGDILSAGNKQWKQSRESRPKLPNFDEAMNKMTIKDHSSTTETLGDARQNISEKINVPGHERRHSQSSSYDNVLPKESQNIVKMAMNISAENASQNKTLQQAHENIGQSTSKVVDVLNSKQEAANSPKWRCKACTFINTKAKDICEMCSKSRDLGQEQPMEVGGAECSQCTLVNPKSAKICQACHCSLKDSPTYI
ncbi:protein tamozhennic isoform X1 [Cylas formicarius]|uniref:protein tamozhennic isoform X1 n=1 Tax=Cylas formicarius TaxID=197179 RepID=UPI002958C63B|nr:protein tamozhennic isoform X1 [Cylas formicarius]